LGKGNDAVTGVPRSPGHLKLDAGVKFVVASP